MVRRWKAKEVELLAELRRRLAPELAQQPPFPEVVGDRRLLKFIQGHQYDIDKATTFVRNMLLWRREKAVDKIRNDIVYGERNDPKKFPFADVILKYAYQIICTHDVFDKRGMCVSLETFNFNPKDVLNLISLDDYLTFLIYNLEYKALILEQLSEERERALLAKCKERNEDPPENYGVMLQVCIIRDLTGLGWNHMSSEAKAIIGACLKIGLNHYSDFMSKSIVINAPWIFDVMWAFVKLFLEPSTIAKNSVTGKDYRPKLLEDLPKESIPVQYGGTYEGDNVPYVFDVQEGSPLWYPGAPLSTTRPLAATDAASSRPVTTPSTNVSFAKVNVSATTDTQKDSPGSSGRPIGEKHIKMTPLLSPLSSSSNTPPAVPTPFTKSSINSPPNRRPFHMIAPPAEILPEPDSTFLKVLYDLLYSNVLLLMTVPIMLSAIYYLLDPYIGMIFVVCISIYHVLP